MKTIETIREHFRINDIPAFETPDGPAFVVHYRLQGGEDVNVYIDLDEGGDLLNIHIGELFELPSSHPQYIAIIQGLFGIATNFRFAKVLLNTEDSKVYVCGEAWVAEDALTDRNFDVMLDTVLCCATEVFECIGKILQEANPLRNAC